jgi:hypothetical protein
MIDDEDSNDDDRVKNIVYKEIFWGMQMSYQYKHMQKKKVLLHFHIASTNIWM